MPRILLAKMAPDAEKLDKAKKRIAKHSNGKVFSLAQHEIEDESWKKRNTPFRIT